MHYGGCVGKAAVTGAADDAGVGGGQSAPSQQGNGIGNHTGNFGEAHRPRAEIVELDSD